MARIPPRWHLEERLARAQELAAAYAAEEAEDADEPDEPAEPAEPTEPDEPTARASFHRLRVAAVERLTPDAVAVTFAAPPELAQAYAFRAGQHLTIRSDHGGTGVRRSYSIAAPAGGPLRVGIKRLPGGAFSSFAVDGLAVGDTLDVMTPAGTFCFDPEPSRARRIVALAVGSGITPVLSVVATALAAEPRTRVTLLFGNRTSADVMFAEDLEDLKNRHPARLQILHVLSREPQEPPLRAGRLDAAKLAVALERLVDAAEVDGWYLCGPQDLVADWRRTLLDAGVERGRVHRELFHAGPPLVSPAAGPAQTGPARRVRFTLDGRTSEVEVTGSEAVLDGVLRLRADAPYACRGGVCGTCRARLVDGEVEMAENYALESDELGAGYVLTCQARPTTDAVTLDYDA